MNLRVAVLLAVTTLPATTDAASYFGNPVLTVVATRTPDDLVSASAFVSTLRVHKCAGGYTDYAVNAEVDFTDGWSKTIAPGDYCGASLRYTGSMIITNGTWTTTYSEPHTSFTLDGGETVYQALTPFTNTLGSFSGGAPGLELTIE